MSKSRNHKWYDDDNSDRKRKDVWNKRRRQKIKKIHTKEEAIEECLHTPSKIKKPVN